MASEARTGVVRLVRDGRATIAVEAGGCGGCGHKGGCAVGRLADGFGEGRIEIESPPGLQVGDSVQVEVDDGRLVAAALLGYLLPALGLLVGGGIGNALGGDLAAAAGAVLGFAAGLLPGRRRRATPELRVTPL